MKEKLHFIYYSVRIKALLISVLLFMFLPSCKDEFYEENKPEWLGESIYDELLRRGNFNYFLNIIDEIGYDEVLKRTGSKTLFVADDEAFERFFSSPNRWGITKFEDFSLVQKKLIMNSSMINDAYLMNMLSSVEGPGIGQALRHETAVSIFDSISFEKSTLPKKKFWEPYRDEGLLLMKDKTPFAMLHFLPKQMQYMGITADDFSVISNGKEWTSTSAYIFDRKVKEYDVVCKNGYIHILDEILLPIDNMSETIRNLPETTVFNNLLEGFSYPYLDNKITTEYQKHPSYLGSNESVYVKRYFSKRNAYNEAVTSGPDGSETGVLSFDPGWNLYDNGDLYTSFQRDMGAIFVPSDEYLNEYFNTGGGKFLKDEFGCWDSVPTMVLADLVNNHMKASFTNSVPSRFDKILDDAKEPMGVTKGDIIKTYITNNGVIYITNKVYAPASYSSVIAPTFVKGNMRAIYNGIKDRQYDAYLLAMDAYYSFIVPTDDIFYYIDPVAVRKTQSVIFKFWYDASSKGLKTKATVYKYDLETGEIGDSVRLATDNEVRNRIEDILEYHIIVGNIEDGKQYYLTKGGGTIRIQGRGEGMHLYGGGDIESDVRATVNEIYDQTKATNGRGNGKTYIVDKPLQAPTNSAYHILNTTPEFSEFFKLVRGNEEWNQEEEKLYGIFKAGGMDYNINFFNRYHYTIYVPTNEKMQEAIANGLPTWDKINALPEGSEEKTVMTKKLLNFLCYHFQDNSVFIGGTSINNQIYETATLNTNINRFYTLTVNCDANNLSLKTVTGGNATVLKSTGANGKELFNIMTRNYEFNDTDVLKANSIESSAFVVIHQIDNVLYCE